MIRPRFAREGYELGVMIYCQQLHPVLLGGRSARRLALVSPAACIAELSGPLQSE